MPSNWGDFTEEALLAIVVTGEEAARELRDRRMRFEAFARNMGQAVACGGIARTRPATEPGPFADRSWMPALELAKDPEEPDPIRAANRRRDDLLRKAFS